MPWVPIAFTCWKFIEDSEDEAQRGGLKAHVELVDKMRSELAEWGLGLGTEP
jgi:hypothetical protein